MRAVLLYSMAMAQQLDTDRHSVTQSNDLIEAAQTLTLNEKRLVLCMVGKLDPRKPILARGTVEIHADEFAELYGIESRGHTYEALEDAARGLYQRSIKTIRRGSKGNVERAVRWVWMAEYRQGEAKVILGPSPALLPYLTLLHERFTTYQLRQIGGLNSFWAIRLYELLAQFRSMGTRAIPIDRFREMLDLTDKYDRIEALKRRVIEPAIAQINAETDLRVSWKFIREGRSVSAVSFVFGIERQGKLPLDAP